MKLLQQILTKNDCYKANQKITPKGVCVHSTGANNPNIKRYVPGNSVIGYNTNNNDWDRPNIDKCVHAFIGKVLDGSVATCQTLPWNWRGWHAGTGTSGKSANNTHISFEICEDALNDKTYFDKVYREAVELTAMLCKEYNLDPLEDGVVICHSEGYRRGIASGHADVEHWFPKFGKSMNDFRKDVKEQMEDDYMTDEKFYEMFMNAMNKYNKSLQDNDAGSWSKADREWAVNTGLIQGSGNLPDGNPNYSWQFPLTREAFAAVLHRFAESRGLE